MRNIKPLPGTWGRTGGGIALAIILSVATSFPQTVSTAPTFPDLDGWTLWRDSTAYAPDNLWDLIDGAADLFLVYGFENLHVGEYRRPDSVDVRVEVYQHSSGENAFGMYSQERNPEYRFLEVGTQGYLESEVLNFFKGKYYVKCSTHGRGHGAQEALTTVARAVADHLKGTKEWPTILRLLPPAGRVPNSEVLIARDFLGYSFFPSVATARYGKDPPLQLFAMPFEQDQQASDALEKFVGVMPRDSIRTEGGYTLINDPLNGRIALVRQGHRLGGVLGCRDRSTELHYLEMLKKQFAVE